MTQHRFSKKELSVLLNKCWMTHDGMWFYHCFQEFGIEKANKMNKAAIASLAPIEVKRIKNALGMGNKEIENHKMFNAFFKGAAELVIPDFMNAEMSFPEEDVLHWEFKPGECFAYKGMQAMGAIDGYECGVIYRIECWIKSLGIEFRSTPEVKKCLMLTEGECSGNIRLHF